MNIIVYSCLSVFSHCRYTLRLLLSTSICDLVKLHVAFFFSVLPFMVNRDILHILHRVSEKKSLMLLAIS